MTSEELQRRSERARNEPIVIIKQEDHFVVHSPVTGGGSYEVRVNGQAPTCTCPDFEKHRSDPDWRCKHILAVEERTKVLRQVRPDEPPDSPEPSGIPPSGAPAPELSQMLIKRSVSPDGRIDSLSVEFSCPVNGAEREIESRAARLLTLQDAIVDRFLTNGNAPGENGETPARPDPDGAAPAMMTTVGAKEGRWGRRLFIRFQVDGRTLWHFGSAKKLKECVRSAAPDFSGEIAEEMRLDVPCRVITKPSDDGRFLNVERVLPPVPAS